MSGWGTSVLVGLFTFFAGLLVGHRLSLWRDRRKEFNDAAAPVRKQFVEARTKRGLDLFKLDPVEQDTIESHMSLSDRLRFRAALDSLYKQPKALERGIEGVISIPRYMPVDDAAYVAAIDRVLHLLRRR